MAHTKVRAILVSGERYMALIYWLGAPSESIAASSVAQLAIEHALEA